MTVSKPQYQVVVDWEGNEPIVLDDFETGVSPDWIPAPGVILDLNNSFSYSGTNSLEFRKDLANTFFFDDVTTPFDTGVFGLEIAPDVGLLMTRTLTDLVVGRTYVVSAWAYTPYETFPIKLTSDNFLYENQTTTNYKWTLLETAFLATATTHLISVYGANGPQASLVTSFLDEVRLSEAGDDITCLVLGVSNISFREGRDQARSLSSIAPAQTEFSFKNVNLAYTPNNPASVLNTRTAAGAPVRVRALFEDRFYTLFDGFIDDFVMDSVLPNYSQINVSAFDQLGRMGSTKISTALYSSIYTGQAVNYVLDAVGWPVGKRDIDYGATVIPWWWEEDTTALDAINSLVRSEGTPAFVFVDELGNFVFRGRHHRYIRDNSINVTAYFQECDTSEE